MKNYILTLNMNLSGGAERQISLVYGQLPIEKIICLEGGADDAIDKEKVIHLTRHDAATSPVKKLIYLPLYAWKLNKVLPKGEEVRILSLMERPNYTSLLLKPFRRHRAIISVRCNVLDVYKQGIRRLNLYLIKWLYRRADGITANSRRNLALLKGLLKNTKASFQYLPNTFTVEKIRTRAAEAMPEIFEKGLAEAPFVVHIGRMVPEKGQWRLLRIFAAFKKNYPNWKLVMLGEGLYKPNIMALAAEYGLTLSENGDCSGDIVLAGIHSNPYPFMRKADFLALTSISEGMPNVMIESLICGTPVLAGDCISGPREILLPESDIMEVADRAIPTGAGVLLPPFNAEIFWDTRALEATEQLWLAAFEKMAGDGDFAAARRSAMQEAIGQFGFNEVVNKWKMAFEMKRGEA